MEGSYNGSRNESFSQEENDSLMTFYSKENEVFMGISFLCMAVIGEQKND